ncbi:hypothetical protein NMY22_g14644 [Coprinellus aureogranulatus]|nr:hypothetical protein NMY22_g14644 [Coprinellus aureogranulatus]
MQYARNANNCAMNQNYDYTKARNLLEALYTAQRKTGDIPSILKVDMTDAKSQMIKHPPSLRLMTRDQGEDVEVTATLQGILCGKALPPLCYKPSSKSLSHLRSLRQHVKIMGLGLPKFDEALAIIQENTPFHPDVDAHGVLSGVQPDVFIHGPDNYVEYCKLHAEGDGAERHIPYNPSLFKIGDVVEIAFSFVGVPVRGGGYRVMLNLRALTLLNAEIREESEMAAMRVKITYPTIKRKRLYLQEDGLPNTKPRHTSNEEAEVIEPTEKADTLTGDMQVD